MIESRALPSDTDLLALHRRAPTRDPILLESVASGTAQGRWDLLLVADGDGLRLDAQGRTSTLDGQAVADLGSYRFESPQFSFKAPDPWIFSPAPSGSGTAVGDGYYLFCEPMSVGQHVLHYTGGFHFEAGVFGPEPFDISADMTYVITVAL